MALQGLRISMNLKNYHLTLCKKLNDFKKRFNKLKTVDSQTDEKY